MRPDSWYAEPGVCGSCIAWRPEDPRAGEQVASGSCRLRKELPRVPATLKKCSLYKPRGQFVYRPSKAAPEPKRRKAAPVTVLRRDESGEMVASNPLPVIRSGEPRERPPVPREVDVGTDDRTVLRAAVRAAVLLDAPDTGRELHGRFEGGKTRVYAADGKLTRELTNERFLQLLERLRASLEQLEDVLVAKDALLDLYPEAHKQLMAVQGSFTTFNFLYASRNDYFTGKE
jgi:hypothetical protein